MFIEEYRLERNPFAADRVRSVFVSHSYHLASMRLAELVAGDLHCLYLSGPPGVGKSTLVRQELNAAHKVNIAWVGPDTHNALALMQGLVAAIGPGTVDGTLPELRRILEVFLRHQTNKGRRSLIVVQGMERFAAEVLGEIEQLTQQRLRGRPVVHMAFTTRDEDLVNSYLARHDGSALAPALHQRLHGFTLDETAAYLKTCIQGAGCEWFDELISADLLVDIQAFTQGIVGDVDALCRVAFDEVARLTAATGNPPRLDLPVLKHAAERLHLRYDATAWKARQNEILEPGAVRQAAHDELRIEAARLFVSSSGRDVAEVTLDRPRMILGRDNNCDISLDSRYVSRYQNLFMETIDGWMLIDLNSTNGCFVNGRRVHEHRLRDGDIISLGQHQLRFTGQHKEQRNRVDDTVTAVIYKPEASPR